MYSLENVVDDAREDRVQQAQVAARDQNETQNDTGQRRDLLAVRPLNALELSPDVLEELPHPTESAPLLSGGGGVAAANTARAGRRLGRDVLDRLVREGAGLLRLELELAVGRLVDEIGLVLEDV